MPAEDPQLNVMFTFTLLKNVVSKYEMAASTALANPAGAPASMVALMIKGETQAVPAGSASYLLGQHRRLAVCCLRGYAAALVAARETLRRFIPVVQLPLASSRWPEWPWDGPGRRPDQCEDASANTERDKGRSLLRSALLLGPQQGLFGIADHEGPGFGVDRVQ